MKFAFAVAVTLALGTGPAFAGSCDLIIAAQVKGLGTPSRSTITLTTGGGSHTFVSIAIGGKVYTPKTDGTWTVANLEANEGTVEKAWSGKDCSPGSSEAVGDEMADIVLHHESGAIPMDTRFWISQASGLPMRAESRMADDLLVTVYDYKDVKAPVAAQ